MEQAILFKVLAILIIIFFMSYAIHNRYEDIVKPLRSLLAGTITVLVIYTAHINKNVKDFLEVILYITLALSTILTIGATFEPDKSVFKVFASVTGFILIILIIFFM